MTLQQLQELDVISSPEDGIAILKSAHQEEYSTPLLARIALVIGAWLSGIFLAFFFGLLWDDIFNEPPAATVIGAIVIAGSLVLFRKCKGIFLEQLALALNLAGTALFLFGNIGWADDWFGQIDESIIALGTVLILCPIVFLLSKNGVQQFISLGWVFTLGWITAFEERSAALLIGSVTVSLGLFLFAWLGKRSVFLNSSTKLAALSATATTLVIMSLSHSNYHREFLNQALFILKILIPIGIGGAAIFVAYERGRTKRLIGYIVFTLLLGLISWAGAPGVAFALGIMVLAHGVGDRLLATMAPLLLGLFLVLFYYFLGVPLLEKSIWLMSLGAVLLISCFLIFRNPRTRSLS